MDLSLVNKLINADWVLTPTRRLATAVRLDLNTVAATQHQVWATPAVTALSDWLQELWQQLEMQGKVGQQLLSTEQAILFLEQVIEQSASGQHILRVHETAKTAYAAYRSLQQWQRYAQKEAFIENVDQAAFLEWTHQYDAWLAANDLLDESQLADALLPLLIKQTPQRMELVAFEEMTPQMDAFFAELAKAGWQIDAIDPPGCQPEILQRRAYADQKAEWLACAQWAKDKLEQGQQTIAVVVPNLPDHRQAIETLFHDVIDPKRAILVAAPVSPYINLSAAQPFSHYPIIHAALLFLKLTNSKISPSDLAACLLSPFWQKSQTQALNSQRLVNDLKQYQQLHTSVSQAIQWLKRCDSESGWLPIFQQLQQHPPAQGVLPISEWIGYWKQILAWCGWPGERALISIEYQAVNRWQSFLEEVGQIDRVLAPMTYPQALTTLSKMAANLPFQPENKQAPVQILGLLEASGQQFEQVWIMGLHNEAWPPVAKPNPFLSARLQRQYQMPHAGPERELAYAKQVTQRFKTCAKEIIFSHPLQEKEQLLLPSELITDVPLLSEEKIDQRYDCAEHLYQQKPALERHLDEQAPALDRAENCRLSVALLTNQAHCPFKAFVQNRLLAKENEWQSIWLQGHQKGTILHEILDIFWREYPSQTQLQQLSSEASFAKIQAIADQVIDKTVSQQAGEPYIEVEKQRVTALILDYLTLEKQRSPFTVIATEAQRSFELAGQRISIRIDRLDSNVDNQLLIIDYKSGNYQLSGLFDEDRLRNVQIPMYFLAMQADNPSAVFVAKLASQACSYEGFSAVDVHIQGVNVIPEWDLLRNRWEAQISQLIDEFQQGHAKVAPIDGAATCQYCHLSAVCRIRDKEESV